MSHKLIREDVPRAAFELARERTSALIGEMDFFYNRSRYIEHSDALGDALANAYIQGVNDTAAVLAKNPKLLTDGPTGGDHDI